MTQNRNDALVRCLNKLCEILREQGVGSPAVDRLIPLKEAARLLGRSTEAVRRLYLRGEIPTINDNGKWFVAESELGKYIENLKLRAAMERNFID